MKNNFVQLICSRLSEESDRLRLQFDESKQDVGVRYAVLDNLLPENMALSIHAAFPSVDAMRLMNSFRERKYTSKSFDQFDPLLAEITFAVQDPMVLDLIEQITGIPKQVPDAHLYAGGLSAMTQGHFLGPHIDNSHDGDRQHYRTLNLLYYVTPDWMLEDGGNLELWNQGVTRHATIVSRFNRLVIMETNPWSWHSVSKVESDRVRCCISNYYFSQCSPTGQDYFNITAFSARPEQKFLRALAWVDGCLRQAIRYLVPSGLGRKDVYEGPPR